MYTYTHIRTYIYTAPDSTPTTAAPVDSDTTSIQANTLPKKSKKKTEESVSKIEDKPAEKEEEEEETHAYAQSEDLYDFESLPYSYDVDDYMDDE